MHLLSNLERIVRIFWFSLYSQVPSIKNPLFPHIPNKKIIFI